MDDHITGTGDRKDRIRLWLRLLTTARLIESDIRSRLRRDFDQTLPRFDVMAQLRTRKEGLTMSELSSRLMVSNGNVTGIVDRLANEGLVWRMQSPDDRRSLIVALTDDGKTSFDRMAAEHESWIADITAGLDHQALNDLHAMLGRLKQSALDHQAEQAAQTADDDA